MKAVVAALAMRRTSKLWSAAGAFFALFFLVLQPVCAAYERHVGVPNVSSAATTHDAGHADNTSRDSGDSTPCCSEMRAAAIASESAVATGKSFAAAQMAVTLPLAPIAGPGLTLRSHPVWSTPPPHPLSYHVRSARIQR